MFERFTDRARRVLVLAQEEAKGLEHDFIGTEHLLLGMLKEGEGVAAKALVNLGADLDQVRAKVTSVISPGAPGTASDRPPFTPRSKKVLELALREALNLNHNYIGTEHLLLGLIHEGEGVGAQVLVAFAMSPDKVRAEVVSLLEGYTKGGAGAGSGPFGKRTPAGMALPARAAERAGADPIGTHHFLLALLDDPKSVAARVLESLGVTEAAVRDRIAAIGTAGTSDEVAKPPATRLDLDLGDGMTLRVEDEELAGLLKSAAIDVQGRAEPGELAALLRRVLGDYLRAPVAPPAPPPAEEPPS